MPRKKRDHPRKTKAFQASLKGKRVAGLKSVKKNRACWMDEKVKNFNACDINLIKWSVVAWTLFLITVWPWLANLVFSVHWLIWLIIGIVLMIRPIKKFFSK